MALDKDYKIKNIKALGIGVLSLAASVSGQYETGESEIALKSGSILLSFIAGGLAQESFQQQFQDDYRQQEDSFDEKINAYLLFASAVSFLCLQDRDQQINSILTASAMLCAYGSSSYIASTKNKDAQENFDGKRMMNIITMSITDTESPRQLNLL